MCCASVLESLQRQAAWMQADRNTQEHIETDWSSGRQQQWVSIYSPNKPGWWGAAGGVDAVCGTSTCMCGVINRAFPIRAVDRSTCPFVWLVVLPAGVCRPPPVCLPVLLTRSNITLRCTLWGNPAWGFGINITFHVSLGMQGCTSCRACCLLCLFFCFFFHDRHVVLHFQPQTVTAGVGPQGQMLHIRHGWHNSCQQTKI